MLAMSMPIHMPPTMVPVYSNTPQPNFFAGNNNQGSNNNDVFMAQSPGYYQGPTNQMVDPGMMMYSPQPHQHQQQNSQNNYQYAQMQQQQPTHYKQIVINSHDNVTGQIQQKVLEVFINPQAINNSSVAPAIERASSFCEANKVREGEQILHQLCGEGQIIIHETNPISAGRPMSKEQPSGSPGPQ